MTHSKTGFRQLLAGCFATLLASATYALPALQLGPTGYPPAPTDWEYIVGGGGSTNDTWVYTGGAPLLLTALATEAAWESTNTTQYAYLVVSTVPQLGPGAPTDYFDINVLGGTLVTSGYGNPPLEDTNDLPAHSIFDTYFEIYQFQFDDGLVTIGNTQPPPLGDSGDGYFEDFQISIISLNVSVTGLHFDLFTTTGNGNSESWVGAGTDKMLVNSSSPNSHDAQWNPGGGGEPIPVPGTLLLVGLGLFALARSRRRS